MRHQGYRRLALMLSVLFVVAVPAQASPVGFQDVVALAHVFGQSGRPSVELRLRSFAQQQQSKPSAQQTAPAGNNGEQKGAPVPDGSTAAPAKSLTGTEVQQSGQQTNVETIELGEVNGTLCDCGDILIPGGGFPKWPLLALGAVPFLFLDNGGEKNPPDFPGDTPQVPEPATIFLLGSGLVALGAGARRARAGRQTQAEGARGEA